jgi:DASS family divalent anion:Na+ symporter
MALVYQTDVIVCAMFLTGQAANPLIAGFAKQVTGMELTYGRWALAGLVPGVIALLAIPYLIYRVFPPEVKHTPGAAEYATRELAALGAPSRAEKLMLAIFAMVLTLWLTTQFHHIDYTVVAFLGVSVLLLSGVLTWEDVSTERAGWDVFIWYGGLVMLAKALSESGITKAFAGAAAQFASGWEWGAALAMLLLIYFYAHYAFASITAHSTAMYIPFLVVILAAGAPPFMAVMLMAMFSNLSASLTHYGTTPAPIYFGSGYVTQRQWWRIGFLVSIPNILIWSTFGVLWWKVLGWW